MSKLGRKDYIMLIADALAKTYGGTLKDYETDIDMAKNVLKHMKPFLRFHPQDATKKEWLEWKQKREQI